MLGNAATATLIGASAVAITVEADRGAGLPGFLLVGLPDSAVRESRTRLEAALRKLDIHLTHNRVLLNLAPADLRKEGSALDLAMALATLVAFEVLPQRLVNGFLYIGELGLDGSVRRVPGIVVFARLARDLGVKALVVPVANLDEARLVKGLHVLGVESLEHTVAALRGEAEFRVPQDGPVEPAPDHTGCFSEVKGQDAAKRALVVAATGGHHALLSGPPGVGKTMLCERFVGLLPDLNEAEQLEVMAMHSLVEPARITKRPPLRAPHHSASTAALVGGGSSPRPGEISLAHRGVLFLDELGEFSAEVINGLRQPLESGRVVIARAMRQVSYDALFQLVAATNPCPCGNKGHPERGCTCSPSAMARYQSRLAGPVLDRIDISINVAGRLDMTHTPVATSTELRAQVQRARHFAVESRGQAQRNAYLRGLSWERTAEADTVMAHAQTTLNLSGRAVDRALRVARSIADLAESPRIDATAVIEALAYRKEYSPRSSPEHTALPQPH